MKRILTNISGIQASSYQELESALFYLSKSGYQDMDLGRAIQTVLTTQKEVFRAIDEIKQALREIATHLETN